MGDPCNGYDYAIIGGSAGALLAEDRESDKFKGRVLGGALGREEDARFFQIHFSEFPSKSYGSDLALASNFNVTNAVHSLLDNQVEPLALRWATNTDGQLFYRSPDGSHKREVKLALVLTEENVANESYAPSTLLPPVGTHVITDGDGNSETVVWIAINRLCKIVSVGLNRIGTLPNSVNSPMHKYSYANIKEDAKAGKLLRIVIDDTGRKLEKVNADVRHVIETKATLTEACERIQRMHTFLDIANKLIVSCSKKTGNYNKSGVPLTMIYDNLLNEDNSNFVHNRRMFLEYVFDVKTDSQRFLLNPTTISDIIVWFWGCVDDIPNLRPFFGLDNFPPITLRGDDEPEKGGEKRKAESTPVKEKQPPHQIPMVIDVDEESPIQPPSPSVSTRK